MIVILELTRNYLESHGSIEGKKPDSVRNRAKGIATMFVMGGSNTRKNTRKAGAQLS